MEEYYFLFALGFLWTIFAVVQDLKTREVSNWLNFSMVTFALGYRSFYSIINSDIQFFLLGIVGFAIFFVLGYLFYYTKTFAGGDAKLLMGYGVLLPFQNFSTIIPLSLIFLLSLFTLGAIYSLIYSTFLVGKNKNRFKKELKKNIEKRKLVLIISIMTFFALLMISFFSPIMSVFLLVTLVPSIYTYLKSLDACMIKKIPPHKLTEGDWLEKDVKIKNITIKKTVHGLSVEDIKILRKYNKSVLIKEGIPFTPAFLLAIIIMVYVVLKLPSSLQEFPFLYFLR